MIDYGLFMMIYKTSKLIYSSVHIDRVYYFIRKFFIPLYIRRSFLTDPSGYLVPYSMLYYLLVYRTFVNLFIIIFSCRSLNLTLHFLSNNHCLLAYRSEIHLEKTSRCSYVHLCTYPSITLEAWIPIAR